MSLRLIVDCLCCPFNFCTTQASPSTNDNLPQCTQPPPLDSLKRVESSHSSSLRSTRLHVSSFSYLFLRAVFVPLEDTLQAMKSNSPSSVALLPLFLAIFPTRFGGKEHERTGIRVWFGVGRGVLNEITAMPCKQFQGLLFTIYQPALLFALLYWLKPALEHQCLSHA